MSVVDELVPFQSLKVENVTQEQLDGMLHAMEMVRNDAREIKSCLFKVAELMGCVDDKGELTSDIDGVKIMALLGEELLPKMPWQKKKAGSFDFIKDLLPVLAKYKNI